MKQSKYLIQINGQYVETFFKRAICYTDIVARAGKYSKKIADERMKNKPLPYTLIEVDL